MKPRVLIYYPGGYFSRPSSGEIEARCLLWGFQLAGFDADVYGLESEDVERYDIFCVFTLSPDSIEFISNLKSTARVLVFPNADSLKDVDYGKVEWNRLDRIKIVARSKEEFCDYTGEIDSRFVCRGRQWFISPFQFIKNSPVSVAERNVDFLAMLEPNRSAGLNEALRMLSDNAQCVILTNDVVSMNRIIETDRRPQVLPRLRYGGGDWFDCLSSSKCLFESNGRVTSSVLEKLWLGGGVIASEGSGIVSELNEVLRVYDLKAGFVKINIEIKDVLYRYHANIVAAQLVREVG